MLCIEWYGLFLLVLMHAAIQAIYCYYMLAPFVNVCGMLNFGTLVLRLVNRMND